jgi:hypothetical protein
MHNIAHSNQVYNSEVRGFFFSIPKCSFSFPASFATLQQNITQSKRGVEFHTFYTNNL